MLPNKILLRHFIIGLISFSLYGAASCKKTKDYAMEGQFYFVNNTSHHITFSAGFEKYDLAPKASSKAFIISDISDKSVGPEAFYSPLLKETAYKMPIEPIIIRFDNIKCNTLRGIDGNHNILNINSYAGEKLAERKYKFVYTFSDSDYTSAGNCQ